MLKFFNDTGKVVNLHPASIADINGNTNNVKPLEERIFDNPDGYYVFTKLWDHYGSLTLLVQLQKVVKENV